jgi:Tfp pilus assembly protein PilF
MNAFAAIERALEALQDGDSRFAEAILESALEDARPQPRSYPCRACGIVFPWPGERADHELRVHDVDVLRAAA